MDPMPDIFDDSLLEDYEEAMEVANPGSVAEVAPETVSKPEETTTGPATTIVANDVEMTSTLNLPSEIITTAPPAPMETPGSVSALQVKFAFTECTLCKKKHSLRGCFLFRRLKNDQKLRHVLIFGYCSRCLSRSHVAKNCKSQSKCGICQRDHHSLLHSAPLNIDKFKAKHKTQPKKVSLTNQSHSSSMTAVNIPLRHVVTFSPTLQVKLLCGKREIRVRAVLDLCCSHSYVSDQLCSNLHIPITAVGNVSYCRLSVRSLYDSNQMLTFTAKVHSMNGIRTPLEDVSSNINSHFEGLQLADPTFYKSGQVALVLGPELSSQILKGRNYVSPGLPLAQYTIFGWVISGLSPF